MVSGFQEESWRQVREQIVLCGNFQKFLQNPPLRSFLLQTGDRILVEANPYDRIWGIGMSKYQSGIQDPGNWRGLNLLGFALMQVRTMPVSYTHLDVYKRQILYRGPGADGG